MLTLTRTTAALAASALLVAGCGESGGDPGADPATLAPRTAPLYAEVVVKPEGEQRDQAEELLGKIMRTDDPGAKLREAFDDATKDDDVSYERDIEPWLGERVGAFLTTIGRGGSPQGAVVFATDDTGAAIEALGKGERKRGERTYKDVSYTVYDGGQVAGAVGDFAVFGTEQAFRSAVDTAEDGGNALAEHDDFTKAVEEAGDDGLATVYVEPGGLVNALASSGAIDRSAVTGLRQALVMGGGRALAAKLRAEDQGFALEAATIGASQSGADAGKAAEAVAALPGDAWLALGVGNVGGRIDQTLEQAGQLGAFAGVNLEEILDRLREQSGIDLREDLLSWMGDAAVFVRGTSVADAGGALVVSSKDAAKSRAAIGKIATFLRRQGASVRELPSTPGVDEGLQLGFGDGPQVILAAAGDRFIAAVGQPALRAALEPAQKLGDNQRFQEAADHLGDEIEPTFFFDLPSVLQLVEGAGIADSEGYRKAQPYLRAFTTIAAGASRDGDVGRARLVVGVR
jgi:Protein of unknown function (DUF3352)